MTITAQLIQLNATKNGIKSALEEKNVSLEGKTFADTPALISNITGVDEVVAVNNNDFQIGDKVILNPTPKTAKIDVTVSDFVANTDTTVQACYIDEKCARVGYGASSAAFGVKDSTDKYVLTSSSLPVTAMADGNFMMKTNALQAAYFIRDGQMGSYTIKNFSYNSERKLCCNPFKLSEGYYVGAFSRFTNHNVPAQIFLFQADNVTATLTSVCIGKTQSGYDIFPVGVGIFGNTCYLMAYEAWQTQRFSYYKYDMTTGTLEGRTEVNSSGIVLSYGSFLCPLSGNTFAGYYGGNYYLYTVDFSNMSLAENYSADTIIDSAGTSLINTALNGTAPLAMRAVSGDSFYVITSTGVFWFERTAGVWHQKDNPLLAQTPADAIICGGYLNPDDDCFLLMTNNYGPLASHKSKPVTDWMAYPVNATYLTPHSLIGRCDKEMPADALGNACVSVKTFVGYDISDGFEVSLSGEGEAQQVCVADGSFFTPEKKSVSLPDGASKTVSEALLDAPQPLLNVLLAYDDSGEHVDFFLSGADAPVVPDPFTRFKMLARAVYDAETGTITGLWNGWPAAAGCEVEVQLGSVSYPEAAVVCSGTKNQGNAGGFLFYLGMEGCTGHETLTGDSFFLDSLTLEPFTSGTASSAKFANLFLLNEETGLYDYLFSSTNATAPTSSAGAEFLFDQTTALPKNGRFYLSFTAQAGDFIAGESFRTANYTATAFDAAAGWVGAAEENNPPTVYNSTSQMLYGQLALRAVDPVIDSGHLTVQVGFVKNDTETFVLAQNSSQTFTDCAFEPLADENTIYLVRAAGDQTCSVAVSASAPQGFEAVHAFEEPKVYLNTARDMIVASPDASGE